MKFRAYDKKFNQMLPTLTMKELCITQGTLDFEDFEDLEIKQVINIQGVDICEDFDIVEFNHLRDKIKATVSFNTEELRYEINVLEAPKHFAKTFFYDALRMKNFKVVGDIFEK